MAITFPHSRWWYRLTVPWIWLAMALVSWRYPGDEYGLFIIANGLPSAFVSLLLFGDSGHIDYIFARMIAFSFVAMMLLSWGMDRLRVWPPVFVPLYIAGTWLLVGLALNEYPSYQQAISKNGSLTAYVSAASNLSLFVSCILCLIVFGAWRFWQRFKAPVAA